MARVRVTPRRGNLPSKVLPKTTKHDKILVGNHGYHYNKAGKAYTLYYCEYRSKQGCNASVQLYNDGTRILHEEHTCHPPPASIEAQTIRRNIVLDVRHDPLIQTPREIIIRNLQDASDEARQLILEHETSSLVRNVRRQRENFTFVMRDPKHLNDSVFAELRNLQDNDGQSMLFVDSGLISGTRFLVFGTRKNRDRLNSCRVILMDATFSTSPKKFRQLLIIYGLVGSSAIPLVWVPMTNQTRLIYVSVLNQLLIHMSSTEHIFVDNELALIQAIQDIVPNVQIHTCQFHISQAHTRKWNDLGWTERVLNQNLRLKTALKRFTYLGFSSLEDLPINFYNLMEDLRDCDGAHPNQVHRYKEYIESTWVGRYEDNLTTLLQAPRYKPEWWNTAKAFRDTGMGTNCALEAHNLAWERRMRNDKTGKPGLCRFANVLITEHINIDIRWIEANNALVAPQPRRDKEVRIEDLLQHYDEFVNNGNMWFGLIADAYAAAYGHEEGM